MANRFEGEAAVAASPNALKKVIKLAEQARDLERTVIDLEATLKSASQRLNTLKTLDIPDAMAQAGLAEFKLPDGTKVSADDFVAGSLPKDPERRQEAIDWLNANGAGGLIKTDVKLSFSKSEHTKAERLAARLAKQGLPVQIESGVHASSLAAYGRERLRNGEETPWEKIGLFAGRKAKFTLVK